MKQRIAVLDYGMGNLHSAAKALSHAAQTSNADVTIEVTDQPAIILQADKVVFPGVGAIRDCMSALRNLGLDQAIFQIIQQKKPLLAICVGMQALLAHSEENNGVDCLNIFSGHIKRFNSALEENHQKIKIPHMGWNQVKQMQKHALWENIPDQARFYFVHSYHAAEVAAEQIVGETHYGETFASSLAQDNIFAVQFHPEKSQQYGLQLLANFITWNPDTQSEWNLGEASSDRSPRNIVFPMRLG